MPSGGAVVHCWIHPRILSRPVEPSPSLPDKRIAGLGTPSHRRHMLTTGHKGSLVCSRQDLSYIDSRGLRVTWKHIYKQGTHSNCIFKFPVHVFSLFFSPV